MLLSLVVQGKVNISAFVRLIHKALSLPKKQIIIIISSIPIEEERSGSTCNSKVPIVSIANEECTNMKVEQLASTLATSAVAMAFAVTERLGQP